MDILISVIIPVYNTSKDKLLRCVNSVLAQTFQNFEIIIIDDGSEEECAGYLDSFSYIRHSIHVIHKGNEGLAMARNTGIANAKGKYIIFVDSDDYIAPYCLQQAEDIIEEYEPDVVIGLTKKYKEYNFSVSDGMMYNDTRLNVQCIHSEQDMNKLINHMMGYHVSALCFTQGYIADGACARVCRRNLTEQALFTTEPFPNEDTVWNLIFLKKCRNVVIAETTWYYYLINSDSMTRGLNENALKAYQYRIRQELELVTSLWPECLDGIYIRIFNDMSALCRSYLFHPENKSTLRQKYKVYLEFIHTDAYVTMLNNISFGSEKRLLHRLVKECVIFFSLHRPNFLSFLMWNVFISMSF
ncbi:MAG: glycosyltransferase [Clostridiales bacterium]|nr:glycosyltransferase [Clostridiales bacterium]